MYNPFPILTPALLKDQLAKGKRYFVRQTFARGMDARLKAAFLLRAYETGEKDSADRHLAVLIRDAHAFLYDAGLPEHLEKLGTAATQPFGYKIFYAAKKGLDWKPPLIYQEKIKHYIRIHHSGWQTNRGGGKIQVGLHEEFGELFLKFSNGEEQETLPFDDIEKY